MAGAVTLRPAVAGDGEFLRRLVATTYARPLPALPADHARETPRFPGTTDEIVLLDGEPIGRLWLNERGGTLWMIELTLVPEQRGAGIGTALFRQMMDRASAAGQRLALYTEKGGRPHAMYLRLGFQVTAEQGPHVEMVWTGEAS